MVIIDVAMAIRKGMWPSLEVLRVDGSSKLPMLMQV